MNASLQELFNISDQLAKNLEIPHKLAVPKMTKIIVNAGIGSIKEDNKAIEKMKKDLLFLIRKSKLSIKLKTSIFLIHFVIKKSPISSIIFSQILYCLGWIEHPKFSQNQKDG